MPVTCLEANILVSSICPGSTQQATVTVLPVAGMPQCVMLTIKNSSTPNGGNIDEFCLPLANHTPTNITVTGIGSTSTTCMCSSSPNLVVQTFTSTPIMPGETQTFVICDSTGIPFNNGDFTNIILHFPMGSIDNCPNVFLCDFETFMECTTTTTTSTTTTTTTTSTTTTTTTSTTSSTTTTTQCPIANPQTCCQVVVNFKTQLVPPALATKDITTEVFFSKPPVVEQVCPEKVIICGVLTKRITFTSVDEQGNECPKVICDESPFQCVIDRDDANEGDTFQVCGFAVLCEGTPRPQNEGTRPGPGGIGLVPVIWKITEKDIVKVCIRKDTGGINPCSNCLPLSPPCTE